MRSSIFDFFETGTSKPSSSTVQKLKVMQAISPDSTSTSNTAGQPGPQRSSPTSFHSRREVSAVRHHPIDTVTQQPKVRRLGGPSRRAHTRRPVSGNASGLGSGPVRRSRANSLQDTEQEVAKIQDSKSITSTKPTYFEKYDTISKNHKKEKQQALEQVHQEKGNTEEERRRRQVVEKEEVNTKEDRATVAKRHRSHSSTQGGSTTATDSNTATTLSSLLEHLRGSNAGKFKIEK